MLFLLLFQRISQKARSQYQADFLTFFFLLFSEQIIDKLLCGTAGKTAVGQFPFVRFCQKLFLTQRHAVSFGQCGNNLLEFFLIRCTKINADAETVYQGQLLLYGVIGVQFAKGQLQIVLGTSVHKYYDIALQQLDLKEDTAPAQPEKKKDFISWFMDMVSGVFGPIVPAIAGAGMIKGLMGGLVALGVVSNATDTYKIIDMLASGVFTFLPFFIAASAAKKFKTNQYLAIAIAATLMYPTMVDAAKAGEISNFMFAGVLPIPVFNYSGSVIPIIFGVFALSYIYKWVDNIVPEAARTVITPTITLFISGFFALTVIGPIGIYIGKALAWMLDVLFGISPIFAGVVMGLIRPASILVGMHHAMTPIALENFATKGYDMLMPMMFIANLSIVGAAAGCYFKEKTQKERSIVLSSVLSGILGITEPALFGVLTKYKKGFLAATIGSCVGSAFIGAFGVRLYGYITSSIFSIPAYIGPYFIYAAIGWVIAFGLSFVLSYLFVVKMDRS